MSYDSELGSDSGSTIGAGRTIGAGGSIICCTILGDPGGGDDGGVAAGDRLLGGKDVGLALGVGSGVLTVVCLRGICEDERECLATSLITIH